MTEHEIIIEARDAFERRDAAERALREIDNEIKELVKAYSLETKVWGFTPTMLRQAMRARLGIAA